MSISLHNRTAYSFGSALSMPEQLVAFAAEHRMPAIALTDLHGLYAAVGFQQACEEAGVKPIFGTEFELAEGFTVTLLAQTLDGYGNLCRLISLRHLRDEPLTLADICEHAPHLVCLVGSAPFSVLNSRLSTLQGAFLDRLYVELAIHRAEDVPTARHRARIADEFGVPVVATCESRCLGRDHMQMLRALASVGTLTLLDQPHPAKPEGYWHLRTAAEMQHLFHRRPDALNATLTIAEQCNVKLDLTRNRFPAFRASDDRSAMEHLRELCIAGCRRRYVEQPPQRGIGGKRPTLTEALERLDRELAIIDQVHYAEYFLVFHEINQYCRGEGIATLARGSAADSLVCYALGVSHACPFRFDLPFDRFLNPERAKFSKMADIDLDLPWDQRDQVVRWVYDRWSHDHVAMIGSSNTFHGRAAIAELGKVFGLPPHEVHRVTKRLPRAAAWNLSTAIANSPEARDLPVQDEPYRTILQMAGAFEGLPRHWSMHPCGLVVSPEPLTDLVPVQRSPKGPLVAQYDMDAIEALGFIKIDLLGQAGLSVLRDTVAEIERSDEGCVDLETDVDYSDSTTWDMIATGEARGVHHIESPAMTSLIRQCDCRDIDGLTSIVAIIRPGAANQGKKDRFARRYQGFEVPSYAHPSLEPVLESTFGLMVFEEHILQIATEFAGMNLGRADVLRRALNKENRTMIAEMKTEFVAGAGKLGRSEREIDAVWPMIEGFAGFMFNKAHSAEYAVEAFQGAWLKRRWPAHYLAAILSNYRGFYVGTGALPQILYVMEALRLGIRFLPPCVNRSRPRFSVEYVPSSQLSILNSQIAIRIPVTHVKGLSHAFLDRYLEERERGPFESLTDFLRLCRPREAESRTLLDSGALDGFGMSRPAMFWQLRRQVREGSAYRVGLWDANDDDCNDAPPIEFTQPDVWQITQREMELLGFPVTIDPLTFLGRDDQGGQTDWSRYMPIDQVGQHLGETVAVCGLMVADRVNHTTSGELMKFVTLADRTGFVEAFLFPDAYQRFGHLTVANPILAATGMVEPFENRNGFTLRLQGVFKPKEDQGRQRR